VSGPLNLPEPPPASGPGQEPPKSLLETLFGIEIGLFDSEYWPTADWPALMIASEAWKAAHDGLVESRGPVAALRAAMATAARTLLQTVGTGENTSPRPPVRGGGDNSKEPENGQEALDNSVPIKPTTDRRVGYDAENDEIVVLDKTSEGTFHGHVRHWKGLTEEMKNARQGGPLQQAW
jgi:hypothetical protein